jgi:hypothetical protein
MGPLGADGPNFTAETLLQMAKKAGTTCIDATALDCTLNLREVAALRRPARPPGASGCQAAETSGFESSRLNLLEAVRINAVDTGFRNRMNS